MKKTLPSTATVHDDNVKQYTVHLNKAEILTEIKNISGKHSAPVFEAGNLTAICEPTV
jgi:hypothetical protein